MMRESAATNELGFSCDCGCVTGRLAASAVGSGVHAVCFCRDCRAAELWLGRPDPAPGPVDVFQTTADRFRIDKGSDRIGLMRLGPKGMMRWYATCCGAPLFNTLSRPGLPFAAIHTARLDDPDRTGPVQARGFVARPGGGTRHEGWGMIIFRVLGGMAAARMSGRWRQTPFFDPKTALPMVPARVLSRNERAALYPSRRAT